MMSASAAQPWLFYAYAILWGLFFGVGAPVGPSADADMFAGPHFGAIKGVCTMAFGLGGAALARRLHLRRQRQLHFGVYYRHAGDGVRGRLALDFRAAPVAAGGGKDSPAGKLTPAAEFP